MDSLVADYRSDSDNNDTDDSSDSSTKDTVPALKKPLESQIKKPALPPPAFDDNSASIFTNPYIEAENAKSAILEKHVKMIPSQEFITEINGKKICWMYRKGRCRFGSDCKYAHDSELYNQDQSKSKDKPDTGQADTNSPSGFPPTNTAASTFPSTNTPGFPPSGFPPYQSPPGANPSPGFPTYQSGHQDLKPHRNSTGFPPFQSTPGDLNAHRNPTGFSPFQSTPGDVYNPRNNENEDDVSQKRKKRPGLSQSIIPGKKVMKMYYSSSSSGK